MRGRTSSEARVIQDENRICQETDIPASKGAEPKFHLSIIASGMLNEGQVLQVLHFCGFSCLLCFLTSYESEESHLAHDQKFSCSFKYSLIYSY